MNLRPLWLMSLILLDIPPIFGLEIHVDGVGQAVSTHHYVLRIAVSDSLPVRRVAVELNGKAIMMPAFAEQSVIRLELPVNLQLGSNLISVRAETGKYRTSGLATVSYDGGDDVCDPLIWVVDPSSAATKTMDSTFVVRGYAYDDVQVAQVTVEGRETQIWPGGRAETGAKGLAVKRRGCEVVDTLGFTSSTIPLMIGWNMLWVEAQDQKGRKTREEIRVFREPPFTGNRWAVVIGVSHYQLGVDSLQYADDDAQAVYDFLLSPQGGGFDTYRTLLLLNEEATSQRLRDALFVFLNQARRADLVVIYFSGHGARGKSDLVYLLTSDAELDRLPSTAFAMYDMQTALEKHIEAERVLVIADACHSGAILNLRAPVAMRSVEEENELVYTYLQKLGESAPGRGVFMASEAREQSQEGSRWGRGHGVFTHYLLEGLKGAADKDLNGIVTLGESIDYTQRHVEEDTGGSQHPNVGGEFDRNMPLAVIRPSK